MIKIKPLIKEDSVRSISTVEKYKKLYTAAIKSKKVINAGGADDYIIQTSGHPDNTTHLLGMFTIQNGIPKLNDYNKVSKSFSALFEDLFQYLLKTKDSRVLHLLNADDIIKRKGNK
jgi:hypothetical protein